MLLEYCSILLALVACTGNTCNSQSADIVLLGPILAGDRMPRYCWALL